MIRALVLLLLLSGCTPPPAPPQVPARLQVCPDGVYTPTPPPSPRTVTALFKWAKQTAIALQSSEAARRDCAGRLDALNSWVLKHVK